jgi:hypothetical protein
VAPGARPRLTERYFHSVRTGKKAAFQAADPADVAVFAVSPDGKALAVGGGPDVNDAREVWLVRVTGVK